MPTDASASAHASADRLPRLRLLDFRWVEVAGEPRLWLRDPLELGAAGRAVLLPEPIVPLLAGCDGTRDVAALGQDFTRRTGIRLAPGVVQRFVETLDRALLLEGDRFREALAGAVSHYRSQPFRPPALATKSYPAEPDLLDALLDSFGPTWEAESVDQPVGLVGARALSRGIGPRALTPMLPLERAAGVLSPHIDYARGGAVYAATWRAALPAVAGAEVVVVFGTDHAGGAGRLTASRLPYATPWGTLPVDRQAVEALSGTLGDEPAFGEELHHRQEHSIELAAVWLHWALRRTGRDAPELPPMVPLLCGSFHPFVQRGCPVPESDPALDGATGALAQALSGRRALVVSAADLAHVGPAFGDRTPLDEGAKRTLAQGDDRLLGALGAGSATAVLDVLREAGDRTRVCGLPPTYWALRLLERLAGRAVPGRIAGYRQCPADGTFGSVVSIAGAVWEAPDGGTDSDGGRDG